LLDQIVSTQITATHRDPEHCKSNSLYIKFNNNQTSRS
jgi:hypothetical protein